MRRRNAFTLLELVIVILILGIVAAVAAPRFANQTATAQENASLQSLSILRSAIEMYNIDNGAYPPESTLETVLGAYLNGPFPTCQIGTASAEVTASTATPVVAGGSATGGWIYNETTGELRINHPDWDDQ